MSIMLKVPFGKYEGESIVAPNRFQLISSEEDKSQALVVFAAMIQNLPEINFIEVEGLNPTKDGWILAGYGLRDSPSVSQLTNIKDECNLRALVTVWWDPARESTASYQDFKLKRAVVAIITKQTTSSQSHSHREVKSLMKPSSHAAQSSDMRIVASYDNPEIITQGTRYKMPERESSRLSSSSSLLSDRQNKILGSRGKSLPLSKGTTKGSKTRKVADIIKNRSMTDRMLDWFFDIKHDQLEKALKGESTDNHHHSSSSDEDLYDDDEDSYEDHPHRPHSSSRSRSSLIPFSLRTLPRDMD